MVYYETRGKINVFLRIAYDFFFTWGVNNALFYPLVEIVYYAIREKMLY